jgi:hypothetical protein
MRKLNACPFVQLSFSPFSEEAPNEARREVDLLAQEERKGKGGKERGTIQILKVSYLIVF